MNNNYLQNIEKLTLQVNSKLFSAHKFEFKSCFGAVAGYIDGHIFISRGKFGTALKLPQDTLTELFREEDVSHLQYFPNGHVKEGYAVIPQRILDDSTRFKKLLNESIKYVLSF